MGSETLTDIDGIIQNRTIDENITFSDIIVAFRDALKQISEKLIEEYNITFNIVVKFSKTGLEATFEYPKAKISAARSFSSRIQKLYKKILKKISDYKDKIEDLIQSGFMKKFILSIGFDIWKFEISASLTFEKT